MAYKDFTFTELEEKFGILQSTKNIFEKPIFPIKASEFLEHQIKVALSSALTTEKAISEALIYPILQEVRFNNQDKVQLFSGELLNVDKQLKLNGEVDFILAQSPHSIELKSPIISIVEAKQGKLNKATPQATAQMYASRLFNQKHHIEYQTIYGAVTSGTEWLFMVLEKNTVYLDNDRYGILNLPE
jgi:hypothetical protein